MSDRLERMRSNPAGDWTIQDVSSVCDEYGAFWRPPSGGGSHYRVGHPRLSRKLTIPFRRPIKPVYIRAFVSFIDAVKAP